MGVVQFMNYLQAVQFIAHVSALNERLQLLDEKVLKLKARSDLHDVRFSLDYRSTSSVLYETIEVYLYRKTVSNIWKSHEL